MAAAMAGLMMAGCQKEEPKTEHPAAPQIEQKAAEGAAAAEKAAPPAAPQVEQKSAEAAAKAKPKDHPAH